MRDIDERIATEEPFKVVKVDEKRGKEIILGCLESLDVFAYRLEVFLPKTAQKIQECIRENKMPEKPLFSRLP